MMEGMHWLIVILAVICTVTQVYSAHASCKSDADCPNGCCHNDTLHGQRCYDYQTLSKGCHLPNHQVKVLLYPCGCATGLVCDEIHFNGSLPSAVHNAELLLLGHGYGICTDTPGTVFGK